MFYESRIYLPLMRGLLYIPATHMDSQEAMAAILCVAANQEERIVWICYWLIFLVAMASFSGAVLAMAIGQLFAYLLFPPHARKDIIDY